MAPARPAQLSPTRRQCPVELQGLWHTRTTREPTTLRQPERPGGPGRPPQRGLLSLPELSDTDARLPHRIADLAGARRESRGAATGESLLQLSSRRTLRQRPIGG